MSRDNDGVGSFVAELRRNAGDGAVEGIRVCGAGARVCSGRARKFGGVTGCGEPDSLGVVDVRIGVVVVVDVRVGVVVDVRAGVVTVMVVEARVGVAAIDVVGG